jgi:hypothetical protein
MALDNGACAGVQVAGARVITKPLPELKYFVERRRAERRQSLPSSAAA